MVLFMKLYFHYMIAHCLSMDKDGTRKKYFSLATEVREAFARCLNEPFHLGGKSIRQA